METFKKALIKSRIAANTNRYLDMLIYIVANLFVVNMVVDNHFFPEAPYLSFIFGAISSLSIWHIIEYAVNEIQNLTHIENHMQAPLYSLGQLYKDKDGNVWEIISNFKVWKINEGRSYMIKNVSDEGECRQFYEKELFYDLQLREVVEEEKEEN